MKRLVVWGWLYRIRCWLDAALANRVRAGDRVSVTLDGRLLTAEVRTIGLESQVGSAEDDLRFALDMVVATEDQLRAGDRVKVELP
jgi:hypothetical protein